VLEKMAEGHPNAGIAGLLFVSQSAVEKHVNAIFERLDLTNVAGYSRRVPAILRYLGSWQTRSFDVVSKVDRQEVDNALNQAAKELSQRVRLPQHRRLDRLVRRGGRRHRGRDRGALPRRLEVFKEKLIKRGISLKAFEAGEPQPSGKIRKVTGKINQGIASDKAKQIAKKIRDEGPRASRRRSRATSCGCPARRRTTCRPSSRCSRARLRHRAAVHQLPVVSSQLVQVRRLG
jgi:uncharacterized protein YajQ (UPF0234 family)